MRQILFIAWLLLLGVPCRGAAQDGQVVQASIPEASESGAPALVIGADNVQQFRAMIAPELFPFVKAGLLSMPAARRLRDEWRLDDAWEHAAPSQGAKLLDPALRDPSMKLEHGFPFGRATALTPLRDPQEAGRRILWNMASMWWGQHYLEAELGIRSVDRDEKVTEAAATLARAYPPALAGTPPSVQLFREVLRFSEPAVLGGEAFLSFRFVPREEDLLWIYSKATLKVRELTGPNRADPVLSFIFSLDDLLGWSGNIRLVDAELAGVREQLVPFPQSGGYAMQQEGSCDRIKPAKASAAASHGDVPAHAMTLPAQTVFVPRPLWKLELASRDPYSLVGREVLYVDQELMLPLIRAVYDRGGKLWKLVLSGFGLASGENRKAPFPAFQFFYDVRDGRSNLITTRSASYCSEFPSNVSLADFDPSAIGPRKAAEPAAAKK